MTMTMQHPARPASRRPGFSLLEIMIAIMIMGLGMVMVATIFPVSLGMARDTVRSDMALIVADAAIATLRAKVPVEKLDLAPPTTSQPAAYAILAPNMGYIMRNQPDQIIDANSNFSVMSAFTGMDELSTWGSWSRTFTFSSAIDEQPFRIFTEKSGWAMHDPSANTSVAYVVPAQNIRNDDQLVVEIPPVPVPSGSAPPLFPRLHLADRVYPAPLIYKDGYYQDAVRGYRIDPLSGDRIDVNPPDEAYLMHLLAEGDPAADRPRPPTYYSWTAIHSRCPNGYGTAGSNPDQNLLVTIVVTHRLSVNSRYARQKELGADTDEFYDVNFDTSSPVDQLLKPGPDDNPETDMVFPVPWLVQFNAVNLAEGEITCTAEVARLLPRGSFFVVAVGRDDLCAGTPHQVLDSVWDTSMLPDDPANPRASLKIAPKAGSTAILKNLAVWVFPPPITGDRAQVATTRFGERSPVIGVALEVLVW